MKAFECLDQVGTSGLNREAVLLGLYADELLTAALGFVRLSI